MEKRKGKKIHIYTFD